MQIEFDEDFTKAWWDRLLNDPVRMNQWLCKLWKTERDGYQDNIDAAEKYATPTDHAYNIFKVTGQDEQRHGQLLFDLLAERGITPEADEQPQSLYWTHVYGIVTDLRSCAAVFALGEELAARRFAVLHDHPGTPSDVKFFLGKALPDETYHARSFNRLAGPDAMANALQRHNEAVALLKAPAPR